MTTDSNQVAPQDKTADLAKLIGMEEEVIRATRTPQAEITTLFNQVSASRKNAVGFTLAGMAIMLGGLFAAGGAFAFPAVIAGWGALIASNFVDKRGTVHHELQKRANARLVVLDQTQPRIEP